MVDRTLLEGRIWSIADGRGSEEDLTVVTTDARASLAVLDDLIARTEDDLAALRQRDVDEREQAIADLTDTLDSLKATAALLRPPPEEAPAAGPEATGALADAGAEAVALQASWSRGQVVVWAAGPDTPPERNEQLAGRLEAIGGPPLGWELHPGVSLPGDRRAEALTIGVKDALGWLVAIAGGHGRTGAADSLLWLAQVALEGVKLVARGSIVPGIGIADRGQGRTVDASLRWRPALVDDGVVDELAASMPATVAAADAGSPVAKTVVHEVLVAVIGAIVTESVERMELPAAPPRATTPRDLTDTLIARMDGSSFRAPVGLVKDTARKLDLWSQTVTAPSRRPLVVRLDAPDAGGVWLVTVLVRTGDGELLPIDAELLVGDEGRTVGAEWARLERLLPALDRAGALGRGRVALSQDEAWEFMTITGPTLAVAGFEVRVPTWSRRKATPSLRLVADSPSGSVVGATQLTDVAWSVLFDDVELTVAEITQLAKQARPLVQSGGRWIEVDRADLEQAAAVLAERAQTTQLTGAEILRQRIGLDPSGLAGGVVVHGAGWANDIIRLAGEAASRPAVEPEGFVGRLRAYQSDALAWIGFLESAELGGCLALDMGLGKTPTVLAHLARTAGAGATLVIAPAAVVGNWAAEAARFAPELRVVVHHGAARSSEHELEAEIAEADVLVTTYATAVRDVEGLAATQWDRIVLDEAQAIKNPLSETAQQLRRIPARTRLALTGTPIENGLGDLWAILDFTNPGLVGPRPAFVAQLSGDGEAALDALNGLLVFRRTKAEPEVAAELPDKIDELDHCTMTAEQIGLYQAVLDELISQTGAAGAEGETRKGAILAAITALKQICNHPAAYRDDGRPLAGRSGKLTRLEEIVESVFAAGERLLVFTHFATWGRRLAEHLTEVTGVPIASYDGSLARGVRDRLVRDFQTGTGPGAMVLSLKAGGSGLNLTAANHVVLYDRWWNPAVEDQARDRAWRIGQTRAVVSHRLVCPGTVDERVEEVVAGKRHIADLVLARSSSIADLDTDQLRLALGLRSDELLTEEDL